MVEKTAVPKEIIYVCVTISPKLGIGKEPGKVTGLLCGTCAGKGLKLNGTFKCPGIEIASS